MADDLDKKVLSETDICAKFIAPAITDAGWNEMTQIWRSFVSGTSRITEGERRPLPEDDCLLF